MTKLTLSLYWSEWPSLCFRADPSTKMTILLSETFPTSVQPLNEIYRNLKGGKCSSLCFSDRSVNQDSRHGLCLAWAFSTFSLQNLTESKCASIQWARMHTAIYRRMPEEVLLFFGSIPSEGKFWTRFTSFGLCYGMNCRRGMNCRWHKRSGMITQEMCPIRT